MTLARATGIVASCLAVAGCGSSNVSNRVDSTLRETRVGEVQITGSEPATMVTLASDSGDGVRLVGTLRSELRNLAGAVVAVSGTPAPGGAFDVSGYEIRSIAGERPSVGVLTEEDGGFWLVGDVRLRLTAVPEGLRREIGGKVWLLGRSTEAGLVPQTYGVIVSGSR